MDALPTSPRWRARPGGSRASLIVALALLVGLGQASGPAIAQTETTSAPAAFVKDLSTGTVLLDRAADEPLPPASMSKLMTLYMVFDALENGRLALTDTFRTSARAAGMGGSKMFIRDGEVVSIENLLRGVIVQSGNDAAVALGEALSGTEEAFAELMNRKAAELRLGNSSFANATGWPHPEQRMSLRDLATLSERLIEDFPELYKLFAEESFEWDDITQRNRNPLLGLGLGVDGLKTGHTEEAGYGLVASAIRGERRIVVVVSGLPDSPERRREAERLVNWAFRAFETRTVIEAGAEIGSAEVWIGDADHVALTAAQDIIVTLPYGRADEVAITLRYNAPVEAPLEAGAVVGQIEIVAPDTAPRIVPLVTRDAVARGGFVGRLEAAAKLLLRRALGGGEG